MSLFQENFWDETGRGFATLLQRLKFGKCSTEALISFFTARIEMEMDLVRRTQRLGKLSFPRLESCLGERLDAKESPDELLGKPADVLGALLTLPEQSVQCGHHRLVLIESMKRRLLCPLEQSLRDQSLVKRKHKPTMVKLIRAKTALTEQATKQRERCDARHKEVVALKRLSKSEMSHRLLEKHEQKLARAQEEERIAEDEYRSTVERLATVREEWRANMLLCAKEFQKVEESRLDLSKRVIVEYYSSLESVAQEESATLASARERAMFCNSFVEIKDFARQYGTGTTIPEAPVVGSIDGYLCQLSIGDDYAEADGESMAAGVGGLARPSDSPFSFSEDSRSENRTLKAKSPCPTLPTFDMSKHSSIKGVRRDSGGSVGSSDNSFSQSSAHWSGTSMANVKFRVQTLYAYDAQEPDEISFAADQFISVLSTEEDPWWQGQIEGTLFRGLFPSNYVQRF